VNHRAIGPALCLIVTGLTTVCLSGPKKVETPLTPEGEKLLATYTGLLNALKAELVELAPALAPQKITAFVEAHAAVAAVPPPPESKTKGGMPRYAPGYKPYADAQAKALLAARALLADAEPFLAKDKFDAKLAKCALLTHATPRGLAEFAQHGKEQEATIEKLLNDETLIKQIMEMGGAHEGKYGQSLEIYAGIQKASKRAKEGFFQRWALAVSLENPDRPEAQEQLSADELGVLPEDADANAAKATNPVVDVMTAMYLNYEQAYLDGKLDPAFEKLTDFNFRFVFPERSLKDVIWIRDMMRTYRPDHLVNPDYKWRYCGIVKTDVPYTSNVHRPVRPDLGLTQMQEFFLKGGICGPRAFTGKLATAAFGIPTRGARQTGHAAMCHWTPEGWVTVFGADWAFNSWKGRCGLDFVLETRAREKPEEFNQVLRAQWLGDAFGEAKVNPMAYGTGGGLWKALAFYKQLAIVEDYKIKEATGAGAELAESNVAAEAEKITDVEITDDAKKIAVAENGTINIPAAACVSPSKSSDKIRFMKSIGGGIQVHYSLGGNRPEIIRYTVEVPTAGKYEFVANLATVTVDSSLVLRLNRRTTIDFELPYTCGSWQNSKPVTLELNEGRNTIEFTSKVPNKGVSFRSFTLTPVGK